MACAPPCQRLRQRNSRSGRTSLGATAIEYGLIAAGIAIAIITAVNGVGTQLKTNFNTITTKLTP